MTTDIRKLETDAEKALARQFAGISAPAPDLRRAAFARFAADGLPHRRIEDWKYTDLRTLMRAAQPLRAAGAQGAPRLMSGLDAHRVVIVNGVVDLAGSDLPADGSIAVESLTDALSRGDDAVVARLSSPLDGQRSPVLDLNTAFMQAGVVLRVKAGAMPARPIHIAHVSVGAAAEALYARSLVMIGDGAAAVVVESHEGPDGIAYQSNVATDIAVGRAANLDYVRVQEEGDAALHLAGVGATIAADASVGLFTMVAGGAVSRVQVAVRFDGPHAELRFAGAQALTGRQHADTTMFIDHATPDCASRELMKTVLDGNARGVFQGKILVRQDAQKTDGKMMTQALILSEGAEADMKPELEIYADDVQCGHGATSGRLDETPLFYLMSRGIPRPVAEALLIESFIGEAIDVIANAGVADAVRDRAAAWLERRTRA